MVGVASLGFGKDFGRLGAKTLGEVASLVPTSVESDCSTDVLDVLQRHCASTVEPQTRLASLGLDSLDAMAVVKDLSDATGKAWSVSDVLGAETLGDITLKAASRRAISVGRSKEPKAEDKIPVKDLEEPCLLRRLWFTLLARIVGAQIAVCGAMPAFVLVAAAVKRPAALRMNASVLTFYVPPQAVNHLLN